MATPKPGEIRCPTCHRSTPPAAFCTQCGSAIPPDARTRPRGMDRDELQERIRARRSGGDPYRRGSVDDTPVAYGRYEPDPTDADARRPGAADQPRTDHLDDTPGAPAAAAAAAAAGRQLRRRTSPGTPTTGRRRPRLPRRRATPPPDFTPPPADVPDAGPVVGEQRRQLRRRRRGSDYPYPAEEWDRGASGGREPEPSPSSASSPSASSRSSVAPCWPGYSPAMRPARRPDPHPAADDRRHCHAERCSERGAVRLRGSQRLGGRQRGARRLPRWIRGRHPALSPGQRRYRWL